MNCPKCNTQVDEGTEFCPNCGEKIERPRSRRQQEQQPVKHGSSMGIAIAAVIFVIAAAVVFFIFGYNNKIHISDDDTESTEVTAISDISDEPLTEPDTEPPVSEEPVTEPTTAEPVTEPTTEEPATEPTTAEPVTEPTTDEPSQEPTSEEAKGTEETQTEYKKIKSSLRIAQSSDYEILPDADEVDYDKDFFRQLTSKQLRYIRNEICAKAGRDYSASDTYADYFATKPWYNPTYKASYFDEHTDELINDHQRHNLDMINAVESERR